MERVSGIGGFFFRSKDPKGLAQWYATHLGVSVIPSGPEGEAWTQEAGPTAFAPFKEDTGYFGAPTQMWMINFRVRSMKAMMEQLRAAGITVEIEEDDGPLGSFARLTDPEGNPIQLWEPK